ISGRYSPATERRAVELHFDYIANGCTDKLSALKDFARQAGARPEEVAYAGDDVNDVECALWAGLGIAVADAVPQLCDVADYVTEKCGGRGAIREAVDMLLSMNVAEDEE
ncbi:MAG: KdsC family phosphatase, partial [Pyramidobacter sp.]